MVFSMRMRLADHRGASQTDEARKARARPPYPRNVYRNMTKLRERIEQDEVFLDSTIVSHGFAPHLRDYDIVIEVPAAKPDGSGSYIEGRYRYRFTHCPEVHVTSAVRDDVWQESWDDHFIEYAAWENAGAPSGFVWGVGSADAYPGLSYVPDSPLADSWTKRLGRDMHEVCVESNAFVLRLVCHDSHVERLAVGDPVTGELTPIENP